MTCPASFAGLVRWLVAVSVVLSGQALPGTGRFDKPVLSEVEGLRTGFFSTCNVITSSARLAKGCGKLELIPCKLELMMIFADFLTTLMSASQAALPCK